MNSLVVQVEDNKAKLKRAQYVLLGCLFLGLFTEVLISPFYPQFFQKVFGIEDYAYTGMYLFICRLTVVIISPLWGFLSKYFDAKHLLFVGQIGTALFTAMMAMAETATQFLIITIFLLLFKSSYMLIYPLIVELSGARNNAETAAKFHAVYHFAIIVSTLVGAWMIELENPLRLFYWAAAADVVQLAFCVWALKGIAGRKEKSESKESAGSKKWSGFLFILGSLFFTLTVANNMIRPFFTKYTELEFGYSVGFGSFLFLLPSVMAIIAMPFIKRFCTPDKLNVVYSLGIGIMAVGLYLQGTAESVVVLILGRMMYGLFLAITLAALDVTLFNRGSGSQLHFHFSVIVTFQTVGELISPLLASGLVERFGLEAPLFMAGGICLINLLLFVVFMAKKEIEKHQDEALVKEPSVEGG